jgi:hypothetical protein
MQSKVFPTLLIFYPGASWGRVVSTTPRPLYPRERPGTHCIGGWVGPRTGLDVCEKSRTPIHSKSFKSILMLSSEPWVCLPNGLSFQGFRVKFYMHFTFLPRIPSILILLTFGEEATYYANISCTLRSSLFCNVTQRRLVVSYRRFGTTYRVPSSRVKQSKRISLGLQDPWRWDRTGCPETSVSK